MQALVTSATLTAELEIQREHNALEIDSPFRLQARSKNNSQKKEQPSS